MGHNVVGSHATITRQGVLCESCGQCKMPDAAMSDVQGVHSAIGQLRQASRAPSFVALTRRESLMRTKLRLWAPLSATCVPTCVAATPGFHTDAENATIFLYATSAAIETVPERLAARTRVFTGLQNRDVSVARLRKQAQHSELLFQHKMWLLML
jgi:hypothetical protein